MELWGVFLVIHGMMMGVEAKHVLLDYAKGRGGVAILLFPSMDVYLDVFYGT